MTTASIRRTARVALLGSLAFVLLVGSANVRAYAEDDDDVAFDTKIFRNVLKSLGLRRDEAGIDYRERSPLVVPPSRTLPPPENSAKTALGPSWPDDPDVKRARRAKAAARGPRSNPEPADAGRPLLPDQYNRTAAANPASRPDGKDRQDSSKPMSPAQLEAKSLFNDIWRKKEEYATFGGEPQRSSLTEPPTGYRTPSPSQPYGVGKDKWEYKPADRLEPVR